MEGISPRILFISSYDGCAPSGQRRATESTISLLKEAHFEVSELILPARAQGARDSALRAIIRKIGLFSQFLRKVVGALRYVRIENLLIITPLGQSIVSCLREGLLSLLLKKLSGAQLIFVLHATRFTQWRADSLSLRFFLFFIAYADRVVVLGPVTRRWLEQYGVPGSKIVEINNAASLTPIDSIQLQAKHLRNQESITVLFLSNLIESKGYLDFLEALHLLDSQILHRLSIQFCGSYYAHPDNLRISSQAQVDQFVRSEVEKLQAKGGKIEWQVEVPFSFRQKLFDEAQIFVFPSYSEAQPLVLLEAVSRGCACITTAVGEVNTIVDALSAIFVEPGNVQEIAEAVEFLVLNPEQRLKLALTAQTRQDAFSPERVRVQWKRLIEDIASIRS